MAQLCKKQSFGKHKDNTWFHGGLRFSPIESYPQAQGRLYLRKVIFLGPRKGQFNRSKGSGASLAKPRDSTAEANTQYNKGLPFAG